MRPAALVRMEEFLKTLTGSAESSRSRESHREMIDKSTLRRWAVLKFRIQQHRELRSG